jgi:hypothetical protein
VETSRTVADSQGQTPGIRNELSQMLEDVTHAIERMESINFLLEETRCNLLLLLDKQGKG